MPTYISRSIVPIKQFVANYYEYPANSGQIYYNGGLSNSSNYDAGDGFTDRRDTNSNPNWKVKVSKNQDASTAYFRRGVSLSNGSYLQKTMYLNSLYKNKEWGSDTRLFYPQRSISDLSYEDAAIADLALQRFKRKLANRTQSYNLIIPLAELRELRQTVDGAANATMKVLLSLADVKKALKSSIRTIKNPKKLRKAFRNAYKDASDIWLTYSFGISPMMSTIVDINHSISSYLTKYDSIDRLTGSATKAWINSFKSADNQTSCSGTTVRMWTEEEFKIQYKFIAGHKFSLASANDYGALDHFGIKPASLIPAAWELTAFSWVIDYFTTAGAFLDDTFTGTSGNSIYVVKNRKFTYKSSTRADPYKSLTGNVYLQFDTSNLKSATLEGYEFRREVLSSYPPRVLRFRTMDEMGLYGVSKLLNLASILSKSL